MVTAISLLRCKRNRINAIAEALADKAGVSEVYSVSGGYDLVVMMRVEDNDALAHLITDEMSALDGIEHTETMLAFRAYSRHDLEEMFSIGQ